MVLPHGGPEANDYCWTSTASIRVFAGMGYVVLQPEYRGSTGYGTEFLSAIYQHFGDRAYRDVDSATDYAIAQGWADPNRLTMFGWSAGGFMTAWTVTQTHRYKAAIEGAGITDWLSFIWTSDVQQIDYDARWPDKDPDAFLVFSAAMHSENVTTPLLILHGAADNRVPTYQGRELFEVLAARGKTTRMVTYPGSPHFPTVWEQRQRRFARDRRLAGALQPVKESCGGHMIIDRNQLCVTHCERAVKVYRTAINDSHIVGVLRECLRRAKPSPEGGSGVSHCRSFCANVFVVRNPAPEGRLSLAQHGAVGGVLGRHKN